MGSGTFALGGEDQRAAHGMRLTLLANSALIHGSWLHRIAEQITKEQAMARFGVLRATRLPPGMTIPDSTTPVNVIRRDVAATLGIDLPDVPDSAWWSTLDAVDHFVAVDSLLAH